VATDGKASAAPAANSSFRLYGLEAAMSVFVLSTGIYGIFFSERLHLALFVTLQGCDHVKSLVLSLSALSCCFCCRRTLQAEMYF
jgi:hypothetical protein